MVTHHNTPLHATMSSAADSETIKMKILATLIIGVAFLGVVLCDQSETAMADDQPITEPDGTRKGQNNPEVVLQLKYDKGELNRIYLTQFRKPKKSWVPSVGVQTNLCEDLCHAGLGGDVCGPSCRQLLPVGLKTALVEANDTDPEYGTPRVAVCPALCTNHLGHPLCGCSAAAEEADARAVIWYEVCEAFCLDNYHLNGCPQCEDLPAALTSPAAMTSSRALSTTAGWQSWCNVQCPQGTGGLACNCDRSPFR